MANFTISQVGLKAFSHAIQVLAKTSKDIYFQLHNTKLTLKSVNETKIAFLCLVFDQNCGMFDTFNVHLENNSCLFCRVASKPISCVFRTVKWTNSVRVAFSRRDDLEPAIIFEMGCNYDVTKMYRLFCEYTEIFQAEFDKNGDSGFKATPSQLVSVFDNLKGDSTEVSIKITENKLIFQSHDEETSQLPHKPVLQATSSLKSETIFQSQDFEHYAFPNTDSTSFGFIFSLKELKHFFNYCESSSSSSISCFYHYDRKSHTSYTLPLCFTASVPILKAKNSAVNVESFSAEIIIATLPSECKEEEEEPVNAVDTSMVRIEDGDNDPEAATGTSTSGLLGRDIKNMIKRARIS